ncbi:uncharacterized protein LOC109537331 [Dendroctonus ponderosae]|uniref:uncharacterized protein LOC109537331 n=1 Tax=Dendroctonus ponderosae TaxID=77166 RepID=UPI0020359DC0|nr:uncharacterized protein LOC109537331 [Dendroctonus ponderosae]
MWKLMVLLYGVLDLLTETANGQVNLERHFSRCKVDNAGFDDCVKEGLNELTPYFESGLPEYGVDPFDPFYAQEVYQKMSGPFFSYKLILRNVSESGWTQSQVTGLRSDFPKDMIQITQFFPDKRLKGIYEIDGTFFGQKVKNSGSWNLALFDYIQTLSISRKPQRDLTGKEMARPPIKVKCNIKTCKKLELHIGNLAGGRTVLENMLDWVINNAWQPGFVVLAPLINDLVGTAFSEIFNKDFQYFPFESIFHQ